MLKKILRFFSKISVRILLLNILIVFIPVASVLLLETYEDQLLDSLEHALYQQGRVLSASLSENGGLGTDDCMKLIKRLEKKHEARIRIVDSGGHLLADSSQILKESV